MACIRLALDMSNPSSSAIRAVSTLCTRSQSQLENRRGGFNNARRTVPNSPRRFRDHLILVVRFGLLFILANPSLFTMSIRGCPNCGFDLREFSAREVEIE